MHLDASRCTAATWACLWAGYKELIIGAGGENVAPVPMENFLKTGGFGISDAMMVGDRQKYNVCLITLTAEGHTGDLQGSDNLAGAALGVSGATTITAAQSDPGWEQHITAAVKAVNADIDACPSNAAKIQKFAIVPNFSVETGEFTPTLKLKRSVVEDKYQDVIKASHSSLAFCGQPCHSFLTGPLVVCAGALWRQFRGQEVKYLGTYCAESLKIAVMLSHALLWPLRLAAALIISSLRSGCTPIPRLWT